MLGHVQIFISAASGDKRESMSLSHVNFEAQSAKRTPGPVERWELDETHLQGHAVVACDGRLRRVALVLHIQDLSNDCAISAQS